MEGRPGAFLRKQQSRLIAKREPSQNRLPYLLDSRLRGSVTFAQPLFTPPESGQPDEIKLLHSAKKRVTF